MLVCATCIEQWHFHVAVVSRQCYFTVELKCTSIKCLQASLCQLTHEKYDKREAG
jgi:hypothetical protein